MKFLSNKVLLGALMILVSGIVVALANPASEHCIKNGGTVEIRKVKGEDGQYGVCVWKTDKTECEEASCSSECEEWAFMRGQCKKAECAIWVIDYDDKGKLQSRCQERLREVEPQQ